VDELESLYQGFQQGAGNGNEATGGGDFLSLWQNQEGEAPQNNPSSRDAKRLEDEIRGIYENRKFINKIISTFLAVSIASAGVNSIAKIGLPIIASGTLGGLVLAVFFGNALSKIKLEGNKPKFDGEFFSASVQTIAVGTALWTGYREQREVEHIAKIGKERFIQEVTAYETKPQIKENLLSGGLITGGALLLLALGILLITKGDKTRL
jgi:hypothetical protein